MIWEPTVHNRVVYHVPTISAAAAGRRRRVRTRFWLQLSLSMQLRMSTREPVQMQGQGMTAAGSGEFNIRMGPLAAGTHALECHPQQWPAVLHRRIRGALS